MDTLKCCVICTVMLGVELTCVDLKSHQNTFEKGKRKVAFKSIDIHTSQKNDIWKLNT